jgi:predicted RNA-binding Zn ribbon-like protein
MPASESFGPTRRGGPVFRWLGEPLAIDLANTVMVVREGEVVDLLPTPADLRHWLAAEAERLAGLEVDADRDLEPIRALREAIRGLFTAVAEGDELPRGAMNLINEASAAAPVAPRLVIDPDGARSAEPCPESGSIDGLLGALARSAIDLLTTVPEGELRVCRAPSCGMYYLGGRRWCCSACGNRARAARHYRRHRATPGSRRRGDRSGAVTQ